MTDSQAAYESCFSRFDHQLLSRLFHVSTQCRDRQTDDESGGAKDSGEEAKRSADNHISCHFSGTRFIFRGCEYRRGTDHHRADEHPCQQFLTLVQDRISVRNSAHFITLLR